MPKFILRVICQEFESPHPDPKMRARIYRVGDVSSVIPVEKYLDKWNRPYFKNVVVEADRIEDLEYLTASHGIDPDGEVLPKRMVRIDLDELAADVDTVVKSDQKMGDIIDVPSLAVCEKHRKVATLRKKDIDDIAAMEAAKLGGI